MRTDLTSHARDLLAYMTEIGKMKEEQAVEWLNTHCAGWQERERPHAEVRHIGETHE